MNEHRDIILTRTAHIERGAIGTHADPILLEVFNNRFMGVAEGLQDERDMLGSIIAMAHRMNMQVVAEGVETDAVARHLLAHGCDFAQGYYFGRPLPAADFFPDAAPAVLSA